MFYILPILSVAIIVGADRLTKYLCAARMALYEEITLIPGFLRLFSTRNNGAAFGMLAGGRWVFVAVTLAALAFMGYCYATWPRTRAYRLPRVCLVFVAGGAVGNGIDRAFAGEVVDFIDFTFMRFAVFNVADICIVCGAIALAASLIFGAWRGRA